jgi:hypothetical protein
MEVADYEAKMTIHTHTSRALISQTSTKTPTTSVPPKLQLPNILTQQNVQFSGALHLFYSVMD